MVEAAMKSLCDEVLAERGLRDRRALLFDLAGVGVLTGQAEAVDLAAAHCVEDAVLYALIRLFKLGQEVLHILSFGCVILGAGRHHYGHRTPSDEVLHVLFGCVEQGTDEGELTV